MIEVVGLDADDTLWESEVHFVDVEGRFRALVGKYDIDGDVKQHLYDVERANLEYFGYGVKSFTLSMIETAIMLSDGAVSGDDVAEIVGWGKEMMVHPIDLLDGVRETVEQLAEQYTVVVMTKGDLLHQEAKVAQSGLADLVDGVDVMAEKDAATYQRIFERRGIDPDRFVMVGNSVRSDILPIRELGGHAIHIPHGHTWEFEVDDTATPDRDGYHLLRSITEVPALIASLGGP